MLSGCERVGVRRGGLSRGRPQEDDNAKKGPFFVEVEAPLKVGSRDKEVVGTVVEEIDQMRDGDVDRCKKFHAKI